MNRIFKLWPEDQELETGGARSSSIKLESFPVCGQELEFTCGFPPPLCGVKTRDPCFVGIPRTRDSPLFTPPSGYQRPCLRSSVPTPLMGSGQRAVGSTLGKGPSGYMPDRDHSTDIQNSAQQTWYITSLTASPWAALKDASYKQHVLLMLSLYSCQAKIKRLTPYMISNARKLRWLMR